MRRIWYSVAASLDGYIAGPAGEIDWILMDPGIDFSSMTARYDTLLMGRHTYELLRAQGQTDAFPDHAIVVVSTTLEPGEEERCEVIRSDVVAQVGALKSLPGRDIWLFGGGELFRTLLDAGLVDVVEVGVIPTLLGAGIPMLPGAEAWTPMELEHVETYKTGIVMLRYRVGAVPPVRSD